ncbi:MAG: hypothetical protein MJ069_00320 [Salinivirgaceae bacterium]|nr:hypothetical protein [Salinivirgaceae bacterium]
MWRELRGTADFNLPLCLNSLRNLNSDCGDNTRLGRLFSAVPIDNIIASINNNIVIKIGLLNVSKALLFSDIASPLTIEPKLLPKANTPIVSSTTMPKMM